jgi:Carboxypeptidase regulatory-like domain
VRAFAIWLLVAATPFGLAAQNKNSNDKRSQEDSPRAVQGTVTNASGQPVANAAVLLEDTKSLQIRSFRTGPDGKYHFAGLSPNVEYQLRAEFEGVTSKRKTLSVFDSKKAVTIDLKLKK